jgi:enoyl-CoA hydratase
VNSSNAFAAGCERRAARARPHRRRDKAFIGGADIREMSALATAEDGRCFMTRLKVLRCHTRFPHADDRPDQWLDVGGRARNYCCLDMRIAVETAVFGMPEVKLGIPSIIEAALLPMLIGWGRTRQILLFGETFSAQEAHSWGLVNELTSSGDLDNAVVRWASCSAGAVRLQKQPFTTTHSPLIAL